jgi:hypothetical protein
MQFVSYLSLVLVFRPRPSVALIRERMHGQDNFKIVFNPSFLASFDS